MVNNWILRLITGAILLGCKTTAPQASVKIVDGEEADQEDDVYGAIVEFRSRGGNCTGQHIGDGYILTAAHCFLAPNTLPANVFTFRDEKIATVGSANSQLDYPDFGETRQMRSGYTVIDVPIPDLAIIRPNDEEAIERISRLPSFRLAFSDADVDRDRIFIAGYGKQSYDGNPSFALRIGVAGQIVVESNSYKVLWTQDGGTAGAAPGDSGGPIFSLDNGNLTLYGIASNIMRQLDEERTTVAATAEYTRIDTHEVAQWIERVTGVAGDNPPPAISRPQPRPPADAEPIDRDEDQDEDDRPSNPWISEGRRPPSDNNSSNPDDDAYEDDDQSASPFFTPGRRPGG